MAETILYSRGQLQADEEDVVSLWSKYLYESQLIILRYFSVLVAKVCIWE